MTDFKVHCISASLTTEFVTISSILPRSWGWWHCDANVWVLVDDVELLKKFLIFFVLASWQGPLRWILIVPIPRFYSPFVLWEMLHLCGLIFDLSYPLRKVLMFQPDFIKISLFFLKNKLQIMIKLYKEIYKTDAEKFDYHLRLNTIIIWYHLTYFFKK